MATTVKSRVTGANYLLVSMVPLAMTMERTCSANVPWVLLEKDVKKVSRWKRGGILKNDCLIVVHHCCLCSIAELVEQMSKT